MSKLPQELYAERAKRLTDAIQLKVPDRVPISIDPGYFPARYDDITCRDAFYDLKKWKAGIKKFLDDFKPDLYMLPRSDSGYVLELLEHTQIKWPGHGVSPNHMHQFVENEYMKADEYDMFLKDPADFVWRRYLPRCYAKFEPLSKLPNLAWALFGGMPWNYFSQPEFIEMLEILTRAAKEAYAWRTEINDFEREMWDAGYPSSGGNRIVAPFDIVSDIMRGLNGTILDMYRQPEKLKAACEKILEMQITIVQSLPVTREFSLIFMPLHRGAHGFMSIKQFENFYWPFLKRLIIAEIEAGHTPRVFMEVNYTNRIEYLLELPKGKFIASFDNSDIFKAKEVLRDHACIMGNVPLSILQVGSIEDVKDYCKKLIKIVGKNGGFILAPRGAPDDARIENLKTMFEFTREYGKY